MLPEPRMPTVATRVFITNLSRLLEASNPVKVRSVPFRRLSTAPSAGSRCCGYAWIWNCVAGRSDRRALSTIVSWAMPWAPVAMRSPGSTGVPFAGVTRWPFALVSETSPVTNVNSPLAAPASIGTAASAAASSRFTELRTGLVMGRLSGLEHVAADRGRDLAAVEVVDVDVGAVVRIRVLQVQRALVAELPVHAERGFGVHVLALLHQVGARERIAVAGVDHGEPGEGCRLRRHGVLEVAAHAREVLALGGAPAGAVVEFVPRLVGGDEGGHVEEGRALALEAVQPRAG